MEIGPSGVPFSYTTVIATKSRIDKGLLAIPASLIKLFPNTSGSVFLLGESGEWSKKTFTAFDSSSKECRIGGMREFYANYDVRGGDELVLQVYGNDKYQIVPEPFFRREIADLESDLDRAPTETEAGSAIAGLAELTRTNPDDVIRSEYFRLTSQETVVRKVHSRDRATNREHIPASLRSILTGLYRGRCQVSGFSFLKRNREPYFEVHHIDPQQGNHVKNVLVVSPNVHAQFTHAAVEQSFDDSGWLRRVKFNGESHGVFQFVDQLPDAYRKEVHSV